VNETARRERNRRYQAAYRARIGREAYRAKHAEWVADHPERQREYWRRYSVKVREQHREERASAKTWCLSIAALNGGKVCRRCGEDDPVVLEFHHRVPAEKRFPISAVRAVPKPADTALVMAEIAKCDVLCANCHRRAHR